MARRTALALLIIAPIRFIDTQSNIFKTFREKMKLHFYIFVNLRILKIMQVYIYPSFLVESISRMEEKLENLMDNIKY